MGSNIEDSRDMSLYSPVLSPRQSKNWEQPIFTTKAHVFQIDPNTKKKWLPASSSAINVSYYFDSSRNTYRIISVEGSKAVINSTITPNMTFTKTSQKFGQWSDNRANTVYGLGFSTEQDLLKFVEKFKEVKELTRAGQAKVLGQTNGTSGSGDINHVHQGSDISNSPQNSPLPAPSSPLVVSVSQNDSVNIDRKSSGSPSLPNSGSNVVEQLKYENDRLKIALAQSSANAKKWEVELQTLKNNNARLTTALQESTTNVEEWKKQLAAYKEESARMKKKVLEMEKSGGGSELLQRQITDLREKCNEMEKIQQNKDDDIMNLKKQINELRLLETTNKKLNDKILTVESEKDGLRKQTDELKHQVDIVKAASIRDKQTLRAIQEQLGSKINELYEMNDKLADVLQQNH